MENKRGPLEYGGDPLDLQVMSDETNGGPNTEERDFPDSSTNQGNNDNSTIMINKATEGTSDEVIEVSELEVNNDAVRPDRENDEDEPLKSLFISSN